MGQQLFPQGAHAFLGAQGIINVQAAAAALGQQAVSVASHFHDALGITGVVLSKLDGSAKGGIVISVQKELGVPVKLVGLGEGPDDLAPFDPEGFVDGILA